MRIAVASDDAMILSWPWEALESSLDGPLALHCRIERQLNEIGDPLSHPDLPEDNLGVGTVEVRKHRVRIMKK